MRAASGPMCLLMLCFQGWHTNITNLRDDAIEVIKQTLMFEQSFNDNLGVAVDRAGRPRLAMNSSNATSISSLNNVLATVGEHILDNKRNSDLAQLLVTDHTAASSSFERSQHDLNLLPAAIHNMTTDLKQLRARIGHQKEFASKLQASIDELDARLFDLRLNTPTEALRLIKTFSARSSRAALEAHKTNREFETKYKLYLEQIEPELQRARYRKRQMDIIAANIVNLTLSWRLPELFRGVNSDLLHSTGREYEQDPFWAHTERLASRSMELLETVRAYHRQVTQGRKAKERVLEGRIQELRRSTRVNKQLIDVMSNTLKHIVAVRTSGLKTASNNKNNDTDPTGLKRHEPNSHHRTNTPDGIFDASDDELSHVVNQIASHADSLKRRFREVRKDLNEAMQGCLRS